MIGLRCLKTRSRKLSGVPIFVAKTKLLFWYLLPRRRRISSCEVLCAFRARATVVLKLIVLRLDWVFTSSIFQPPPFGHQIAFWMLPSRLSRSVSVHLYP